MATLRLEWTPSAKAEFEKLKKLASERGKLDSLAINHQEIVDTLTDLGNALVKGELLFTTRKPGGEVRHWVCGAISVCYVVRRDDSVGWILRYTGLGE